MNRIAVLLGVASLASGAATVYYAQALKLERIRIGQMSPAIQTQSAQIPVGQVATSPPATSLQPAAPKPATRASDSVDADIEASLRDEKLDPGRLAVARRQAERLRDPKVKARAIAADSREARQYLSESAPYIGLSREDIDKLAEVIGVDGVEGTLDVLECQADPDCDETQGEGMFGESFQEEATRLVGPEKLARLMAWFGAFPERFNMQTLRDSLPPESRMSDAEIEMLSIALGEERQKFEMEAEARNETVEGSMSGLASAAVPGSATEFDRRLESATRFVMRRNERAEQLLRDAHLSAFKAWQDRALATYKSELEDQAIAAAARKAAGTEQPAALP